MPIFILDIDQVFGGMSWFISNPATLKSTLQCSKTLTTHPCHDPNSPHTQLTFCSGGLLWFPCFFPLLSFGGWAHGTFCPQGEGGCHPSLVSATQVRTAAADSPGCAKTPCRLGWTYWLVVWNMVFAHILGWNRQPAWMNIHCCPGHHLTSFHAMSI